MREPTLPSAVFQDIVSVAKVKAQRGSSLDVCIYAMGCSTGSGEGGAVN